MTKKPSFWTNFGPFWPNFGPQIFLWILPVLDVDIIASNHCMQFQGKLKNQNMRKWKKKLVLDTILAQWPKFGLSENFLFSKI